MPKIEITETFEETSTSTTIDNAVVVPYLTFDSEELGAVHFCRTLAEYADYIGSSDSENGFVYVMADNSPGGSWGCVFVDSEDSEYTLMPDRGYLMASTLLSSGYYVAAVPVPVTPSTTITGITGIKSSGTTTARVHADIPCVTFKEATAAINGAYNLYATKKIKSHSTVAELLKNKKAFPIRKLTTGGYPNIDVIGGSTGLDGNGGMAYKVMLQIAEARGDCVAMVDLPEDIEYTGDDGKPYKDIIGYTSKLPTIESNPDYMQCVFPYADVSFTWQDNEVLVANALSSATYGCTCMMPGSYFYLLKFLSCLKGKGSWFSPSGLTRGIIGGSAVNLSYYLTEAEVDILDGTETVTGTSPAFCINPIISFANYGTVLWGNRTGKLVSDNTKTFENFMNIRELLCDIKKQIYRACLHITFEPNDDFAWGSFKTYCNEFLEGARTGRGIKSYYWTKLKTTQKGLLKAQLTIVPIEALEDFTVNVNVTDEATVEITEG